MKILLVPACEITYLDQLGLRTLLRCATALKLFLQGGYDYLVVSGGLYELPHLQTRPAADIMHDWFFEQGVSRTKMLVEDQSLDNFENVAFSLKLLREKGVDLKKCELEVVTQRQHAWRFWLTFLLGYFMFVKLHKISYVMTGKEKFMEFLFLLVHFFWPKMGGPLGAKNRRKRRSNRERPSGVQSSFAPKAGRRKS